MSFNKAEAEKLLAECGRQCCICGRPHRVQVHHIVPGDDNIDNGIPLCPNCHDEVHTEYSPGRTTRTYTPEELKRHRKRTIDRVKREGKWIVWDKPVTIIVAICILAILGWLLWSKWTDDKTVRIKADQESVVQAPLHSPGAVIQNMSDSPGGIQVGGDLNINHEHASYVPLDKNIRTNVLASIKAVRMKFGDSCPVVRVTVQQGNRDRVAQEIVNLLKDASFKPIPFAMKQSFRKGAPPAVQIKFNPHDKTFVTDLIRAIAPLLGTQFDGRYSNNRPAGEVEMVLNGEPIFQENGSIKFD